MDHTILIESGIGIHNGREGSGPPETDSSQLTAKPEVTKGPESSSEPPGVQATRPWRSSERCRCRWLT